MLELLHTMLRIPLKAVIDSSTNPPPIPIQSWPLIPAYSTTLVRTE